MKQSKIAALGIPAISVLLSFSFSVSTALASTIPTIVWTGVNRVQGSHFHAHHIRTTFQQPDPAYSGSTNTDLNTNASNLPSFTQHTPSNSGLTGLNIPALNGGLLPDIGDFKGIGADYSAPGTANADTGLSFVVQTADGLYHTSSFTGPNQGGGNGSLNFGMNNGRTKWHVFQPPTAFSPPVGSGDAGIITKIAVVFAGSASTSTINQLFPPVIVSGPNASSGPNAYQLLTGKANHVLNDLPGSGTDANFSLRIRPIDSRFNFELTK